MSVGGKPSYSAGMNLSQRADMPGPLGSGQPQGAVLFAGNHRPTLTDPAAA